MHRYLFDRSTFEPFRNGKRLLALGALALLACSHESGPRGPRPDEVPTSIEIPAMKMTAGFKLGRQRKDYEIAAFRITRTPITVWQYQRCIEAGACESTSVLTRACGDRALVATAPQLQTNASLLKDADTLPATCVPIEQAEKYCGWLGARLPTAEEWSLAARGTEPRRFAWGEAPPLCTQFPGGRVVDKACSAADLTTAQRFQVGTHAAGASPYAMQDVLVTPSELLAVSERSQFPSCRPPQRACAVRGVVPGAIDAFAPVPLKPDNETVTAGFRCVWSEVKP